VGDWLEHSNQWGQHATGIFVRRKFKQLSEVIARSKQVFTPIGAKYNEQKSEWIMPGGARLLFRYLERDSDAMEYQGHSYTRVYVEEATNFPFPDPIDKLRATLRTTKEGLQVGLRLTGNPGGPGHLWVKKRYIDPDPAGWKIIVEKFMNPFTHQEMELERVFIPSKLSDNEACMRNDPLYAARLQQQGSKQLVEAWLLGLWDIIDGAFFSEWDSVKHVLPYEWLQRIPPHSYCYRSFDWGYAKPFSCGWYVMSDGTWGLPRGALVKIDEWYGCTEKPNTGLRLDAGAVAEGIKARDEALERRYGLRVRSGVADPAIFIKDGGPSIAEEFMKRGVIFSRADNKRVPGWVQLRTRLVGDAEGPQLYFMETCDDTIRTLPTLQHEEKNLEDLDTDGEDHAADETRYACMARPVVRDKSKAQGILMPKLPGQLTFNDLLAMNRKKRLMAEAERA